MLVFEFLRNSSFLPQLHIGLDSLRIFTVRFNEADFFMETNPIEFTILLLKILTQFRELSLFILGEVNRVRGYRKLDVCKTFKPENFTKSFLEKQNIC